ncbi:MAG: ArpU family phage packaging/lysis transcriptional regulator [Solibacillus sp.]|uniref:ArpU family phage packaging/lysis transcriptional regulator n=1 Tax=Solibacillus sp. TaxID=1909654 RepID=UPI003314FA3A
MTQVTLKIDEKRTKKSVERELIKYRDYLITLPNTLTPKITPAYSIIPPSNTNEFSSKTENVAIERVMYEQERNNFMNLIHAAVDTLKPEEKKIIIECYLLEETLPDIEIWTGLHMGRTKFYQYKCKALMRLAFALKKEVYAKLAKEVRK